VRGFRGWAPGDGEPATERRVTTSLPSTLTGLTLEDRKRIMALHTELMRDKSYELLPMGEEVAEFLRHKRRQFTANSLDGYESTLNRFAREFGYLEVRDFEPPVGRQRVEEFLDKEWGDCKATTFNCHLFRLRSFFRFQQKRGALLGDPTAHIEKAKARQVYRETFSEDQCRAVIAAQDMLRDRIAVRLMLHYGLRRGAMLAIQFKHFDHVRKHLTVFLKGGKVQEMPIPEPAFWHDLERHILDSEARPDHYLMQARWSNKKSEKRDPRKPMSPNGAHRWWYRCLARAGVVDVGTNSGERPHKARHTAGQRVLDKTRGNLKATQKFLGHSSIQTTADTYTDWDRYQLENTLADVFAEEADSES
jgi:integrase